MFISYEDFLNKLENKLKHVNEEYKKVVGSIIKYPHRYTGLFRLSNIKTKLIQNITQSREIRFGDFLEEIITEYLSKKFKLLDKSIKNINGETFKIDHFFRCNDTLYVVEQKIRDDHDSSKKVGQFINFVKKYETVKELYPENNVKGVLWFIDDNFTKNKKYYWTEIQKYFKNNEDIKLFYGGAFFDWLDITNMWQEIRSHLLRYKIENANFDFEIPDFDKSDKILDLLVKLPDSEWDKLYYNSDEAYDNLRKELFPTGSNLERAKRKRNKKQ
ncbi:Type II restriction modification system endonuclease [Mycoplasmopsis bovigenitalium 51080]|uniref:type II site-specific deoxyribonuclease n=1 Tax=Mycoplasmopsis bovigenitalium 51080 TaxID=1188235 RepID=N9TU09_9BACT|nr:hypothetical protein [Mycoplasmopsis bovigenitalium]ENY69614.1 Type II restriction modification system endonuclease [Mycoplasmopsis bovigenitalium 51080]